MLDYGALLKLKPHPPKKRIYPPSFKFILMPQLKMFVFFLQCCQGMEFLNANVSGDMTQLLQHNQGKYVPVTVNKDSTSPSTNLHLIAWRPAIRGVCTLCQVDIQGWPGSS